MHQNDIGKNSFKKKKPWKLMVISKVALNPEQAVLSCCDSSDKAMFITTSPQQCWDNVACIPSGTQASAVSS